MKYFFIVVYFISDTPWGGLPLLEVDGKKIGQSMAIARYIAREHGKHELNLIDHI